MSPTAVIDGVVRPGDVVLTGSGEGLSFLIRSGLGSEVSHAAIAVAPGWGVEARDGRADTGERTPAVYLRTTAELVSTPQLALAHPSDRFELEVRRSPHVAPIGGSTGGLALWSSTTSPHTFDTIVCE